MFLQGGNMSSIEWEPVNQNLFLQEEFINSFWYASKFFNSENLLLISECESENVYRMFNFSVITNEKKILDNHIGTKYSFSHNGKIILHTYDKNFGGVFWRKF